MWTAERRFTGSSDLPLSADGQAQSEAAARALAGQGAGAVCASPLERARTSAEIIAKPHRLDVEVEPAFREMGFGAWEGLTAAEVEARFPDACAAWREAPHGVTIHGGECLVDVADRVAGGLQRLREAHAGQTVLLVTHAIVIRLLVLAALGLGPERLWSVDASPAGITELEYAKDWVTVHRMNTLAHLDAPGAGAERPPAAP